jgi:phosphoesterase RecJ-like protein
MQPPQDVLDAIARTQRPLIVGHVRPDGDCFGSMFALAAALLHPAGRQPALYYRRDHVSQRLAFLQHWRPVPVAPDDNPARSADALLVLDTARSDRAAVNPPLDQLAARGLPVVNIDHHLANAGYGTANWVVPQASSTSELVYRILDANRWPLTPDVAALLYAGIHTDTHGFSLPNTTASSLHAAAALVDAGAPVTDLCQRLWRSQAKSEFDLCRIIYDNTRLTEDGRIAYSTATYDEITRVGCTAADIDDQVTIPRALNGIRMAILFTEGKPDTIRMNFRGEAGTDVLELAKSLGGGGHAGAAGAILDGPIHDVVATVLAKAAAYLK